MNIYVLFMHYLILDISLVTLVHLSLEIKNWLSYISETKKEDKLESEWIRDEG